MLQMHKASQHTPRQVVFSSASALPERKKEREQGRDREREK